MAIANALKNIKGLDMPLFELTVNIIKKKRV